MRIARQLIVLTSMMYLIAGSPVRAAEPHDISLGPQDRYELGENAQWRYEVVRELSGRFADVKIKPLRGDDFSLSLYFLADTSDPARFDTPQKIERSVTDGVDKYLSQTVEKKATVQALSPHGSYGALVVLTAASVQGAPGEYKYQTRGMVRLSSDAALGFALLSKDISGATYQQVLDYVYSFIKLAPKAVAAPVDVATPMPTLGSETQRILTLTPGLASRAVPTPKTQAAPRPKALPIRPSRPPRGADKRDCLTLPTDAEIMRCVGS